MTHEPYNHPDFPDPFFETEEFDAGLANFLRDDLPEEYDPIEEEMRQEFAEVARRMAAHGLVPPQFDINPVLERGYWQEDICSSSDEEVRHFVLNHMSIVRIVDWAKLDTQFRQQNDGQSDEFSLDEIRIGIGQIVNTSRDINERELLLTIAQDLGGQLPLPEDPAERESTLAMMGLFAESYGDNYDTETDYKEALKRAVGHLFTEIFGHYDDVETIASRIYWEARVYRMLDSDQPGWRQNDLDPDSRLTHFANSVMDNLGEALEKAGISPGDPRIDKLVEFAFDALTEIDDTAEPGAS